MIIRYYFFQHLYAIILTIIRYYLKRYIVVIIFVGLRVSVFEHKSWNPGNPVFVRTFYCSGLTQYVQWLAADSLGFRLRLVRNPVAASLGIVLPLRSQRDCLLSLENLPMPTCSLRRVR